MKKLLLVLIGLIPFGLGFAMNSWLMDNPNSILPFRLIGILFLVFWVSVGFITCKYAKTPYHSAVILHLPALFVLLLVMYQDIVLEEYWSNLLGLATQVYYLPLINLSSFIFSYTMTGGLFVQMSTATVVAFLLMYGSYYVGCYFKKVVSRK